MIKRLYLFARGIRGFAAKDFIWGCVKSLFMALRAKFKFETDVFFMILRSKIMKNTSVSKKYSAAEGGKNLFTQPQTLFYRAATCYIETKGYVYSIAFCILIGT
jgi:hypothetical protein